VVEVVEVDMVADMVEVCRQESPSVTMPILISYLQGGGDGGWR